MTKTTNTYLPEVRQGVVRMILEGAGPNDNGGSNRFDFSTMECAPQTLNDQVKKAAVDRGDSAGVTTEIVDKIKAPEREDRKVAQANEILREA